MDKDLVVFFDEADLLSGHGLISFLAQVRDGYIYRDETVNRFPRSMALVGMRDIRDYLIKVRPDDESTGEGSPFNIANESLTLYNFTKDEIRTLYGQHSEATGQAFDDSAIDRAWYWTGGQPWLVNALAKQIVSGQLENDHMEEITGDHFDQAAATLIKGRSTHVGSLLARLQEPRVIKVMDAVFAGIKGTVSINSDDRQFCLDLGLLSENENRTLRPANKIYEEVMSRTLTDEIEHFLDIDVGNRKWTDGQILLMSELLREFQGFWRQGSDSFPFRHKDFAAFKYDEATYSFMLLAYLQKIVNSGGLVYREYAEGRGAVDICVQYAGHDYLVEVKLKGEKTPDDWQTQLAVYLDAAGQTEGWLVIFDRDRTKTWDERIYWKDTLFNDKIMHLVGC
ncbi:MAG: ATP-binding protein [Deltaproteobacteria bacterium]|nr:ATP-binding protein [Deltaproteobacteria bacterium]